MSSTEPNHKPDTVWRALAATMLSVAVAHAEPPREYQQHTPAAERTEFRLWSPSRVYRDTATFRVDPPGAACELLTAGEDEPARLTCRVRLRHLEADRQTSVIVKFQPTDTAIRHPARRRGPPPPCQLLGAATADISDWPDGTVETRLALEPAATASGPAGFAEPAAQHFKIVREQFARVAPAHADELAVWLDDANSARLIWGKRPLWPGLDDALARPEAPYDGLRGFMLRSYHNPQLDRLQPYTLYVPRALELAEPAPLMILLHGSGGDYRNLVADYAAGQRFESHPMLIANAGAFRHQEYRHMALNDVRGVIEDVSRKYKVDPARVFVQGISLGGRGGLELAALLPDQFAGVSAQGVYGVYRQWLDPLFAARADPVALALAARQDIRTWMPNLFHTPVEFVYGWKDPVTPPVNALMLGELLRDLGYNRLMRGFDADHNITLPQYDWASTRKWFLQQRKTDARRAITLRAVNLRYARAGPVQVEELHDYARIGELRLAFNAADKTIELAAANIARLTVDLPFVPDPAVAGGQRVTLLVSPDGAFEYAPWPYPGEDPRLKHPGRSGPIWDIWCEPVTYVYDTAGADEVVARLKQSAEQSAAWDIAWGDPRLPVKPDTGLTGADKQSRNIVFFTTRASANPLRNEINAPDLPHPAEEDAHLRIMLRPSPWSARHCVLVVELDAERPFSLHEFGWFQEAFQADWLVVQLGPGPRSPRILAAGVYDRAWQPGPFTAGDFRSRPLIH
jgi:predicted esterase